MARDYDGYKIVKRDNYDAIYLPTHHLAYDDGMVYVHEYAAEKILGRPMTDAEVVHHIDFDKTNNSAKNLMIFASSGDHTRYHNLLKGSCDFALICINKVYYCVEYAGGISGISTFRDYRGSNNKIKHLCPICGNPIVRGAKLCKLCSIKKRRKVSRPSKKKLLKMLFDYKNFVKIGKLYGVTDNAIRKWCAQYGLPTRTNVIRKMSLTDWNALK